jgi:DNA-binding transcriptional ArsR family regulator
VRVPYSEPAGRSRSVGGGSRVRAAAVAPELGPTEVFRALSDPVRWTIVSRMAEVDELACSTLEDTLNVSKPTISYHTKILVQTGLISVRKEGRNFFYTLRRDVLRALIDDIWALAPEPVPVRDGRISFKPATYRRRRPHNDVRAEAAAGAEHEAIVLTW